MFRIHIIIIYFFRSLINHLCNLVNEHGRDFWWTLPLDRLVPQAVLAEHGVALDEVEKGQVCWGNHSQIFYCIRDLFLDFNCGV